MPDLETDGWKFNARPFRAWPTHWHVTIVQPDGHVWGGGPLVDGAFTRRGACKHASNVVRLNHGVMGRSAR